MTHEDGMEIFRGSLTAEVVEDENEMFMSNNPDDLFYRVPRRVLSFIDGCPSMLAQISLDCDEENDRLIICANEAEDHRARFTISFTLEKLYKLIQLEGIGGKEIEDTLFATNDKQAIIIRAISAYLRKNVRIQYY